MLVHIEDSETKEMSEMTSRGKLSVVIPVNIYRCWDVCEADRIVSTRLSKVGMYAGQIC